MKYAMTWLAGSALAGFLVFLAVDAYAGSGKPYEPDCSLAAEYGWFERYQCDYDNKEYITDYTIPQSYMVPKEGKLNLEIFLHRDQNMPSCDDDNFSKQGALVMKVCAGHYPSRSAYEHTFGWFGIFGGNLSNPLRIAHGIKYAEGVWGDRLDLGKGVTIRGASYGGTGSILQSYFLTELIDIVDADLAWTHFQDRYDEDPEVRATWGTYQPVDVMDAFASGNQDHIYYRVRSSSQDSLGRFNPRFIEACEKHKVACYVTWDEGNHSPEINHNPNLYTNPYMEWRKDRAKVIFTGSSANITGSRGHYNEGLSFAWFGNDLSADKPTLFRIPLTYQPRIIEKLPLMPDTVSFNVTIRDYQLEGEHFVYEFGNQSGEVWAVGGEITIHGLVLDSQKGYEGLTLRPAPKDSWELVYVESNLTTKDGRDMGLWDHAPDLRLFEGGFPESDIAIETKSGKQKIIHNCTTNPKICVTGDPRVSPDGKKIIYWEGIGAALSPVKTVALGSVPTGAMDITALTECRLWVYEIDTGDKYPITEGHCDRTPEWLNNGSIVFPSNRERTYVTKTSKGEKNPAWGNEYLWSYQLHRGNIVDRKLVNIENIGPHENIAISPDVSTNGWINYTAHNAGVQNRLEATIQNGSYIAKCDSNGAQCEAEFQKHSHPVFEAWALLPTLDPVRRGSPPSTKAIREVAEINKGELCATSYYGGNNKSTGCVYCWKDEPGEGALTRREITAAQQWEDSDVPGTGQFIPSSTWLPLPWCNSQDELSRRDKQGRPFGKAGGMAPHTEYKYMFTWCEGECYTHAIDVTVRDNPPDGIDFTDPKNTGGLPSARRVIAAAKVRQVTDPFDINQIEILSSHPEKHRYNAQQIRPYRDFYGQELPIQIPRLKPGKALLIAESVHAHQVFAQPNRTSKYDREAVQGNIEPGLIAEQCLDYKHPHKERPTEFGYIPAMTDCVPVDKNGRTEQEVIPDMGFLMSWFDAEGNEISRDHSLHSLRPGETRCCAGCHLHSEDAPKCAE